MDKKTLKNVILLAIIFNILFLSNLMYCIIGGFYGWQISTFITLFMFAYHFDIRLLIGAIFTLFIKKNINILNKKYIVKDWEFNFYNKLRVKSWKDKYFVMDKSQFVMTNNLDVILKNNICAELIHIFCIIFSYLSIIFGCLLSVSEWWLYLLTAFVASVFIDMLPIIIQRYNRYRLQKIYIKRHKKQ